MIELASRWRVLAAGTAVGVAAVVGSAGQTASAEPLLPAPVVPGPVTVTQTVTVAPAAAPVAAPGAVPAATPAAPGVPGAAVAPGAATIPSPAAAAPVAQITPASSGTFAEFFKSKGVKMEPQVSHNFKALSIVLPLPSGWTNVPDPNVPDAFAVIADRSSADLYTPNAQVVVYKLIGDFDPAEAISHGFVDTQQLQNWRPTDMAMGDFNGFPSAFIEGSYMSGSQMLNTSRRHILATAGQDRYLVSLSVNSSAANQGISAAADAADAIVSGFKVSAPAPAAAPPPATPAAPAPAPAPGLPQLLGLQR
ncbi:LpqN/LpqT family lipoprotein [Mycolicibacterium sp. 050232]|uniref:LpqN/LpqT family lipoprotein n=1 Tax=Mycolicibacterium sp. 050232 TaxID=3113982 RepID=UPI002E2C7685|nr:LpqN/LpqT family lipoprotein [Mycolicibacterium sp. 050232]MED5815766.1 LpqN/LpqT family lipoprotein [Mycolicibacterium sp. 050232]